MSILPQDLLEHIDDLTRRSEGQDPSVYLNRPVSVPQRTADRSQDQTFAPSALTNILDVLKTKTSKLETDDEYVLDSQLIAPYS